MTGAANETGQGDVGRKLTAVDILIRVLLTGAVVTGGGSAYLSVRTQEVVDYQTRDRFFKGDGEELEEQIREWVRSELELRDERIGNLDHRVEELEDDVERIDRYGPSIGNADLRDAKNDHEARIRDLEVSGRPNPDHEQRIRALEQKVQP